MYIGSMDAASLLLYVVMGLLACCCIKKAKAARKTIDNEIIEDNKQFWLYASIVVFAFVILATFRKVGVHIGGTDAHRYVAYFEEAKYLTMREAMELRGVEWLFSLYEKLMSHLFDDYRAYFFVTYGFVTLVYMMFILKYGSSDGSAIPYMLIAFLFLKGFCTMRTMLAVSVFMLGLMLLHRHRFWAFIVILLSVFVHRASMLFVPVVLFDALFRKKIAEYSTKQLLLFVIVTVVLASGVVFVLRDYVLTGELLSEKDSDYVLRNEGISVLSRWPMYFAQLLLLICLLITNKRIVWTEKLLTIKTACVFDFIMVVPALILGFWRANEYLYVARLVMWGSVIKAGDSFFTVGSRRIFRAMVFLVFLVWLVFRLYSEWDELKIMPYIFSLG